MKVLLSWLKELVEITCSTDELAERLSISGFEVESINDMSLALEGVVVGYVLEKTSHPNADKLSICKVDIGQKEHLQIVCGANNVRSGIHVLVAKVGTYLNAIDLLIKASKLRGVESQGMICSLGEIGLQSESEGIAVLEEIDIAIPNIGVSPKKELGMDDTILDLAITANRPDGMSMIGIAREVSAILESKLNIPSIDDDNLEYNNNKIKLPNEDSLSLNGLYTLSYIDDLDIKRKLPNWLINRLEKSGIRSINPVVDIVNYVMLEQGQPLHAFDSDLLNKITDRKVNIEDFGIRNAHKGESCNGLDNHKYELTSKNSIITCANIPVAIAGIIGCKNSAVNNDTRRIWLEAALFDPSTVRLSAREIGIRTESSSRFEKGISPQITFQALKRTFNLFRTLLNATIREVATNREIDFNLPEIEIRRDKVHNTLGLIRDSENPSSLNKLREISDKEIEYKLTLIGCVVKPIKTGWQVTSPAIRQNDLTREIDFIEEIARLIGYEKFDNNLPFPLRPGGLNVKQKIERDLREYLCATGFQEVSSYSLVGKKENNNNRIPITNPLLQETSFLRTNLWEEHLNICRRNLDIGRLGCWVFEIGKIYQKSDSHIKEINLLCGALTGNKNFGRWQTSTLKNDLDYFEARGLLASTIDRLNIEVTEKRLENDKVFHPGKASLLYVEGNLLGKFGQLHPLLASQLKIDNIIYLFELNLELLTLAATRQSKLIPKFRQFSTQPSSQRDIAMIIDKRTLSKDIINLIMKKGKPFVEKVELIDRYEGPNIEISKVSLAFRITYRDQHKTLKETDVNPKHDEIRSALINSFSADLRS